MDQVIENILKRKNKTFPYNDGKVIALVLYGGVMSGVLGTIATTVLEEENLTDAFDYIFTFSAGLPNASYFLSKQSPLSSSVYIDDLSGSKFINFFRFWNIADVKYLIHILRDVKTLHVPEIFKRHTKLIVQLKNRTTKQTDLITIDQSYKDVYFDLIYAAVKMPFLNPGSVNIKNQRYKDGGGWEEEFPSYLEKFPEITDVLIIYNRPDQKLLAKISNKNVFEITPPFLLGMLETNRVKMIEACNQMRKLMKSIFNN